MADNPIQRLIERRHPEHAKNVEEWKFVRRSLEGGPGYVAGNLFKHPKEDPNVFAARSQRAADHHVNFTAQVRDTYVGYLFQQAPAQASNLPDWLETFIASGDEEGRPLVELAKDAAGWSLGYGVIWVGVDKPRAPVEPSQLTAAAEAELGLEPYAYLVHPTHVLDGKIKRGRVVWLLLQEDDRDDEDPIASSGEIVTRYRLWTETEWKLIAEVKVEGKGAQWQVVEEGPNPIGRAPFIPIRYGSGTGFASPGFLQDIAHLDRAIFNQSSLKDEILYTVTFPQLAIPYVGDLYEEAEGGGFQLTPEGQGILTMGLHTVIPFNAEAGAPTYVTPGPEAAATIQASIDKIVRMLLAMALLDGEVAEEGGAAPVSGVNKAYTFEKLNRRLAVIADRLEAGFRAVFELVALWLGKNPDELPEGCLWDFPDSFEVRSLAQDLEEFAVLMAGSPPSATARAELWLEILRKAMPKVDPETWATIEEEVRAMVEQAVMGMGAALEQGVNKANGLEGQQLEDDDQVEDEQEEE